MFISEKLAVLKIGYIHKFKMVVKDFERTLQQFLYKKFSRPLVSLVFQVSLIPEILIYFVLLKTSSLLQKKLCGWNTLANASTIVGRSDGFYPATAFTTIVLPFSKFVNCQKHCDNMLIVQIEYICGEYKLLLIIWKLTWETCLSQMLYLYVIKGISLLYFRSFEMH